MYQPQLVRNSVLTLLTHKCCKLKSYMDTLCHVLCCMCTSNGGDLLNESMVLDSNAGYRALLADMLTSQDENLYRHAGYRVLLADRT